MSDWPRQQCLFDLAAVARVNRSAVGRIADGAVAERLASLPDAPIVRLETDEGYLPALEILDRASVGDDTEAAAFAWALLLADGLCDQVGPTELWRAARPLLEVIPRPQAAALWRGAAFYHAHRYEDLPGTVPENAFLSDLPDAVISPLVTLARGLDEHAIQTIARADYGNDVKEHVAGLRATLADDLCCFPSKDRWYPAEVVELTGHLPNTPAAWRCIALLILDDIHNRGAYDQMNYRWQTNAPVFLDLPEGFRIPILRGIRHIMEQAGPGAWNPFFDWHRPELQAKWHLLPWLGNGASA